MSTISEVENSEASNSDSDNWESILGHNWRSIQFNNSPATSLFEDEDPALFPVGANSDSESGSSANGHSEGSLVSDVMDFDADDELDSEDSSDEDLGEEHHPSPV